MEKLSQLRSAVAGLDQIRYVHYFSFKWMRSLDLGFLVLDFDFDFSVFVCSENEKSGFINLVSRYLRWIQFLQNFPIEIIWLKSFFFGCFSFVCLLRKGRNSKENVLFFFFQIVVFVGMCSGNIRLLIVVRDTERSIGFGDLNFLWFGALSDQPNRKLILVFLLIVWFLWYFAFVKWWSAAHWMEQDQDSYWWSGGSLWYFSTHSWR